MLCFAMFGRRWLSFRFPDNCRRCGESALQETLKIFGIRQLVYDSHRIVFGIESQFAASITADGPSGPRREAKTNGHFDVIWGDLWQAAPSGSSAAAPKRWPHKP